MKRFFINLGVLAATLTLMVVVSEAALRLLANPPFQREHHRLFVEYDPLLGWRKIPGKSAKHVATEYTVTESINSKGLRGPEFTYAKDSDELRTLILGDSFAEGYSVGFQNLSSELVARHLRALGGSEYTVINAGTGGYSTDQEYLFFQSEGVKYQPDLTIVMFYANDVLSNNSDHYWRGYKPLFQLAGDTLRLTNVPVPKPDTAVNINSFDPDENRTSGSLGIRHWLNDNSRLYSLIREAVLSTYAIHRTAIWLGLAEGSGIADDPIPVPTDLEVYRRVPKDTVADAWQVTERLICALRDEAAGAGSKLAVFYVPVLAEVYDDEWNATKRKYGMSATEWNVHQAGEQLENICRRNNIDIIIPTERFCLAADSLNRQDRRLYFPLDRHWTAEGHGLAAEILTDYITANLPTKYRAPDTLVTSSGPQHEQSRAVADSREEFCRELDRQ